MRVGWGWVYSMLWWCIWYSVFVCFNVRLWNLKKEFTEQSWIMSSAKWCFNRKGTEYAVNRHFAGVALPSCLYVHFKELQREWLGTGELHRKWSPFLYSLNLPATQRFQLTWKTETSMCISLVNIVIVLNFFLFFFFFFFFPCKSQTCYNRCKKTVYL